MLVGMDAAAKLLVAWMILRGIQAVWSARRARKAAAAAVPVTDPPVPAASRQWDPPNLDTAVFLPDRAPWVEAPEPEPESEPEPEAESEPCYDESRCWGCEKNCKRRNFKPFAGFNPVTEAFKANANQYREWGEDARRLRGGTRHGGTSVDSMWIEQCYQCVEDLRENGPWVPPTATVAVAAEECPF